MRDVSRDMGNDVSTPISSLYQAKILLLDNPLYGKSSKRLFDSHIYFFSIINLRFYHTHLFHPYRIFVITPPALQYQLIIF